jgi:iron(III) transport system ATP-binding protein
MTTLSLSGVTATYAEHVALRDLSLDIPAGRITAVVGPSGCGKSTMIRVLAGFHRVRSGVVRIGDQVVDGQGAPFVRPEKRGIGVVPQDIALFPNLDVAGNVGYGIRRWGRYDKARVAELLALVGLPDVGPLRVHQLSGGQQQRVAVARALAPQPLAVMLDEPFTALDQGLRESVRADVREALRAQGATGVLVTHDQEEALSIADHVVLMRDGSVVQSGAPKDVYDQPADLWAARFLGDLVELPADGDDALVSTPLGVLPVAATASGAAAGGTLVATLRPEQLHLDPAGVDGRVADITYYGHDAMITVNVVRPGGGVVPVRWRTVGGLVPEQGEAVRLGVTGGVRVYRA